MNETFTADERRSLEPFFTNIDRPVFGLKLPQEVAAALFSRYSRSTKNLRRTFLDEFLGDPELALKDLLASRGPAMDDSRALEKARAFFDRVLVGYGDDSVAQLGGAHIACERISNVAVKFLEDSRIGIAPLEKSTRYVRFDQKDVSGDFLFHREPRIMASSHRDGFLDLMRLLFETYSSQIEPMIEFVKSSLPMDALELRHPQTGEAVTYADARNDEKLKRWAETAYRSTVRAHACDVLRSYLPAATLTNVGLFGVGQAFEYLLTKLYSSDLTETRDLASAMHGELNQIMPSFVKRAGFSEYLAETYAATGALTQQSLEQQPARSGETVALVDHDSKAEEKIVAALLYPHATHPLSQIRRIVEKMSPRQRRAIMEEAFKKRRHRRDKPGRAFEQVYYTFDILGNLGAYRDLQRHRILTQERQDFTTIHGYESPPEIKEAGFQPEFDRCMEKADALYAKLNRDLPREAQYVVPFAYKIRWTMKMNLREAVFICELRSMPQGHPDYRFIAQEIWRLIGEAHPALAAAARFMDWRSYRLGRLSSELRTEYKKSALK